MPEYEYDVAISFLARDEPLALELRDKLGEGLSVFVYSKEQERVAGTEGLESFREVFRSDCRLVVALYRDGWGETPWTRVEQTAITDRALKEGWDSLLFITLDKTSTVPKWLPETRIRLSLPDYGVEQAAGAIKARSQELGARIRKHDAVAKARQAIGRIDSHRNIEDTLKKEGYEAAQEECSTVVAEVGRLAGGIQKEAPDLKLKYGCETQKCTLTTGPVSMNVLRLFHAPRSRLEAGRAVMARPTTPARGARTVFG